ncbi:MAG: aminotransferase class I/II-fold pyridoxal phosphate-dependent enzyme [Crocinitomicaceae bacterium]|nr:aminotransferase class I/II-fold pyridoxal phosphate-dependent enzyme [Crocinitomicaceae bacterium]
MAKINHHNFVDTINDILSEAKKRGVLQLEYEGSEWKGDTVLINDKEHVNFGTCGYMGLETHPKVIQESLDYTRRYGTQFSVSRTYLVSKENYKLEEYLSEIFLGKSVIAFTSTTMAHMSVIPIIVGHNDAIILDQQAHISMQTIAQQMAAKGVPIEMIRHSNLEMLEHKVKSLYDKHDKIWYVIDGVYSMYGDTAPIEDINALMAKYDKLHLYVDDAHGMSWYGKNGCGRIYEDCLKNEKTMYISTLAKGFGTMGGIAVFPEKSWYDKLILHGGPLAYSHPMPPPMLGAAIGAAKLHLSDEIYEIQNELKNKLSLANSILSQTDIPVLSNPETPIYFIGTGQPNVGYNFNKRLIDEGYYMNIGMFPAVPVKNTGLRFTITNHNTEEQIRSFCEAIIYHHPKALEEEGKTLNDVRKAFRLPLIEEEKVKEPILKETESDLTVQTFETIKDIDKKLWDSAFADKGNFDWEALELMERAFSGNDLPEENWKFHYILVTEGNELILATFFTSGLFKDDLLAQSDISKIVEDERKNNKYYLSSKTLSMGSLFTEGDHLFIQRQNIHWKNAIGLMIETVYNIEDKEQCNSIILRDFALDDEDINHVFHELGFFSIDMPNTNIVKSLPCSIERYYDNLSGKKRKHIRDDVFTYLPDIEVKFKSELSFNEIQDGYELYRNVSNVNFGINLYPYPEKIMKLMSESNQWEYICLYIDNKLVGIGCCYKSKNRYYPVLLGLNYDYNQKFKLYKQILFQAVSRAIELNKNEICMGLSADLEKRKFGAEQISKKAFVSVKDQYNMELLSNISVKMTFNG